MENDSNRRYKTNRPNGKSAFWVILLFILFRLFFDYVIKCFRAPVNSWWAWILQLVNMLIIFAVYFWSEITFVKIACEEQFESVKSGCLNGKAKDVIFSFIFVLSILPMIFIWMADILIIDDDDLPVKFILICSILLSLAINISFTIKVMCNAWTLMTKLFSFFHIMIYSTAVYIGIFIIIINLIIYVCKTL